MLPNSRYMETLRQLAWQDGPGLWNPCSSLGQVALVNFAVPPRYTGPLLTRPKVASGSMRPRRGTTNRRYRHRGVVNEVERAKNCTKSRVRARVEHAIGVIKRVFGFAKVHYRGLKKNMHRLLVTCALANLFMVRRQLLGCKRA
jgi:DDE family transposase